jgi:hypothetical protein
MTKTKEHFRELGWTQFRGRYRSSSIINMFPSSKGMYVTSKVCEM